MCLNDFVELALHNFFGCYVFDNENDEVVFMGTLEDIPEELLESDFSSWEITENGIGLNIN